MRNGEVWVGNIYGSSSYCDDETTDNYTISLVTRIDVQLSPRYSLILDDNKLYNQ